MEFAHLQDGLSHCAEQRQSGQESPSLAAPQKQDEKK